MNAQRRKRIQDAVEKLDDLKGIIETLRDEEREYYDNMPEALQAGDRGMKADEAASNMEYAADQLDEAISNLNAASE